MELKFTSQPIHSDQIRVRLTDMVNHIIDGTRADLVHRGLSVNSNLEWVMGRAAGARVFVSRSTSPRDVGDEYDITAHDAAGDLNRLNWRVGVGHNDQQGTIFRHTPGAPEPFSLSAPDSFLDWLASIGGDRP